MAGLPAVGGRLPHRFCSEVFLLGSIFAGGLGSAANAKLLEDVCQIITKSPGAISFLCEISFFESPSVSSSRISVSLAVNPSALGTDEGA
jgi:hypothetical protein